MSKPLKIRAEGENDLIIISSVLQDAILKVGEIHYQKSARTITLRLSRFRHEAETDSQRQLCGLRLDGVLSLVSKGIERTDPEAYAVLLSLVFEQGDAPGGKIRLVFAGGGEILCNVECVDAILADIQTPRETDSRPLHPGI